MREIERTTDGKTLVLRCVCCGAQTTITEDDYQREIVHDPSCLHAARTRKLLRDAGIRTSR